MGKLSTYEPHEKWHITNNIGIGGEWPEEESPEVDFNSKEFTEKVKALHYDLDRAKDVPTRDKLVKEFTDREAKLLWNESVDKIKEFFIKTWDLTENLSNNSTDYCDYAEFLDEYFDEDQNFTLKGTITASPGKISNKL